jgi:hypothetical protein
VFPVSPQHYRHSFIPPLYVGVCCLHNLLITRNHLFCYDSVCVFQHCTYLPQRAAQTSELLTQTNLSDQAPPKNLPMSAASTSIDAPKANANAIASSSDASGRQQVQRYGKKLLEILKVHAKVKREIKDRRNALDNPDDRIVHQYERNFKPVYDLLVLERDLLEKAQESGMELLR